MAFLEKLFKCKPERDNNYYCGMLLLVAGILTIVIYLLIDGFEPLAFLITFLISGWGLVLLWKSDNDLRFKMAEQRIKELETELGFAEMFEIPAHLRRKIKARAQMRHNPALKE